MTSVRGASVPNLSAPLPARPDPESPARSREGAAAGATEGTKGAGRSAGLWQPLF